MTGPGEPERAVTDGGAVARSVALGAAFMVLGRLLMRLVSVVSVLILARLLVPEDFGIIILASVAISLAEALTAMPLTVILVRRAAVDRDVYDSAWTLNLLRYLVLAGALAATAPLQAWLLGDDRIGPVLLVVAGTMALDMFTSIGLARLEREMRFNLLFRYQVVEKLVAFLACIGFALWLQNYWCLVLGNLVSRFVVIPYGYWLAPHRPRLCLRHAREMLHFSKWMLLVNVTRYVEQQGSNLVLGRLVGVQALGIWGVSYQLAAAPVTELAVPMRAPIFAGYARVQHDPALLRAHYFGGLGLLAAVLTPLSVGAALLAPQMERAFLGANFAGAAPVIAICATFALIECLAHFTGSIFLIKERQNQLALTNTGLMAVRIACLVPAAIIGGVLGVGAVMVGTSLLGFVVWQWLTAGLLGASIRMAFAQLWRPFLSAAAMIAVILPIQLSFGPPDGVGQALVQMLGLTAIGGVVHSAAHLLLWRLAGMPDAAERHLLDAARALPRRVAALLAARESPGHAASDR